MVRPASSDKCFFITVIPTRSICYSATTRTGHLEEDHPVTRCMKTKDSQVFFLQTDQFKVDRLQIIVVAKKYIYVCVQFHNWFIHEFEGCFLRGQVSSNGFKVFNPVFQQLHSWTLNFIGQFGKKTWESFVSKKLCKWIIFFQVPRSSGRTVNVDEVQKGRKQDLPNVHAFSENESCWKISRRSWTWWRQGNGTKSRRRLQANAHFARWWSGGGLEPSKFSKQPWLETPWSELAEDD